METTVLNNKGEPVTTPSPSSSRPARLIRTMKSDADDAIKHQNETVVTIAVAEQKKKAAEVSAKILAGDGAPTAGKPIGRIVVVFIVLIIIATLGALYVYALPQLGAIKLPSLPSISIPSFFSKPTSTTPVIPSTPSVVQNRIASLVSADSEKVINITGMTPFQVFQDVIAETKQNLAIGFIRNIYFNENTATSTVALSANKLFSFANITIPEIFARSLDDVFMVGLLGESSNRATPFIILKVADKNTGVAGMLEWEARLPGLFDTMFGTDIKNSMTPVTRFRDTTASSKDARILTISPSKTIIYSFANKNTIVIAGSKTALETLLPIASIK